MPMSTTHAAKTIKTNHMMMNMIPITRQITKVTHILEMMMKSDITMKMSKEVTTATI